TVVGFLHASPFCSNHFVSACNSRLNALARDFSLRCRTATGRIAMRSDLGQTADQVYAASLWAEKFDEYSRIGLLELMERLGLLLSKIRRGERVATALPVRLGVTEPSSKWVENTETRTISRHGASLRCSRPFVRGDVLTIKRLDTGNIARARVVWR